MTENVEQTGCPSFDDISAFMDGEADSSVREHIGSCKQCQHVLASLQILDSAVGKACQVPAGLNQRILNACNETDGQDTQSAIVPFWGRSVVRYAAAVALTLALGVAVHRTVRNSGNPGGTDAMVADAGGANPQAGEAMTAERRAVVIDNEEVAPVGVTGSQMLPASQPAVSQRVLASTVSHVWGAKDLSNVKDEFASLLPKDVNWGARSNNQAVVLQVKLTDAQLQKLVESMHAKGWALFSPQLPQPGEKARVKLTGNSVVYQAQFVPAAAN